MENVLQGTKRRWGYVETGTWFQERRFSPMTGFTAAESILCSSLQQGWNVSHLDFENDFPNGLLNLPMSAKLPKHVYNDIIRAVKSL